MPDTPWMPHGVDPSKPSPARIYDYVELLDGAALQRWFAERGAPPVEVRQSAQQ